MFGDAYKCKKRNGKVHDGVTCSVTFQLVFITDGQATVFLDNVQLGALIFYNTQSVITTL